MTDIAQLELRIDASQALKARQELDKLATSSKQAASAADGLAGASKAAAAAENTHAAAAQRSAGATKLTRQQMPSLQYTINDITASLASGASPFTILAQQGGQVTQAFGGVSGTLRTLGGALGPVGAAVGGLSAAVAGLVLVAAKGYAENKRFEESLLLTGNRAGTTADEIRAMSRAISDGTQLTVRATREAAQAAISVGQFGAESLGPATRAIGLLAERTGRTADDVAKDFAKMQGSVSQWAAETNRSYNFLTAAQFSYIRQLEATGQAEKARAETLRILADQIGQRTPRELGLLERSLEAASKTWAKFWDAALNVGRPETIGDQLDAARAAVNNSGRRGGTARELSGRSGTSELRDRVDALREQQRFEDQAARRRAESARANIEAIEALQSQSITAGIELDRAGLQRRQAIADVARASELVAVQRQFDQLEISQERYAQRRLELDRQAIGARARAIDAEIELERRRAPASPTEATQQQARLIELETRRIALQRESIVLDERRRRGDLGGGPRQVAETPSTSFRAGELQQQSAVNQAFEQGLEQRRMASFDAARDLVTINRQLSIDQIRDDRARGQALIALEAEQLRRRLDLTSLNAEERARVEANLAIYVAQRNAQLTEELKPEWQRMVDGWRDTHELMRKTSDEFQANFLRTSEDAFAQFVKTGELSLQSLGDLLVETLARFTFQSNIGPAIGELGTYLSSSLGLGAGTPVMGAGGMAADASGAAAMAAATSTQTAAITASTTSLTAQTTALGAATTAMSALTTSLAAETSALAAETTVLATHTSTIVAATAATTSETAAITSLTVASFALEASVFGLSVSATVAAAALQTMAAQALAGTIVSAAAADGAVFPSRGVSKFAKGGVVSAPSLFRFAKGGSMKTGLMGEAGPEAIMPLQRGPGGALGVQAFGGSASPHVTVNIIGGPDEQPRVKQRQDASGNVSIDVLYGQFVSRLNSDTASGYGVAPGIQRRFGGSGAANLGR